MTAQDIINRALRIMGGNIAAGESPSSAETADGLTALIALLDGWSAEELMVHATRTAAVTLATSTVSYSISGTRPVKILSADTVINAVTTPVEVVGPDGWARVPDRNGTSAVIRAVYCDYAYPTPAVLVAPIPSSTANSGTLNLYCMVDLATVAAAGDSFAMPEGYTRAVAYNLALEWASEFGREIPPSAIATAQSTKAALMRANASNRAGKSELVMPPVGGPPAAAE